MGQTVWGLGIMFVLTFLMSAYAGYTKVLDAGTSLTATVKHAIAGSVMKPSNDPTGGGYYIEGVGGTHLVLNMATLTEAVETALPESWPGSQVTPAANGGIVWTLPNATNIGYGITGPATISAITDSNASPPTLTAMVSIPIQVPTWVVTWHGVIHREIILPLAGQTGPQQFVQYSASTP